MNNLKEFVVKECRRCHSFWFGETRPLTLHDGDQLAVVQVKVAYCKNCKEHWDREIDAPTYHRLPRKK